MHTWIFLAMYLAKDVCGLDGSPPSLALEGVGDGFTLFRDGRKLEEVSSQYQLRWG